MTRTADVAVVGAGIVGLAMADALLAAQPGSRIVVLEKEDRLAEHASGRNSGVIHAGFYYSPESLKALLTRRGNVLLHEFCDEHGVPVRRCGKIVVARTADELGPLQTLADRAAANGVPVEVVDEQQAREIEPLARTFQRALWSPTTSSASPTAVVEALAERIRRRGGEILLGSQVVDVAPGLVRTRTEELAVGHMVNAAGLYADRMARPFGVGLDYVMLPFKGVYWYGESALRRHVYPVPDPRNPFLGVHLTVTVDGHTKIGPTAIPALWREDYGGLRGLKRDELAEVGRTLPKFARSPHHDVASLVRTEVPNYSRRHLVGKATGLVPSVQVKDFRTKGRPGIRAQLFHLPTRRLEMDFVVEPGDRSTHILNAVSPAWTSSLAFAEHVVEGLHSRAVW